MTVPELEVEIGRAVLAGDFETIAERLRDMRAIDPERAGRYLQAIKKVLLDG